MDDQIVELCTILKRLWAVDEDEYFLDDSEDIKAYTTDGVPIRKLFIGNIAQRTTHKDLEKLFCSYGKLDSCFLKRNVGQSNFAFVTFNNIDDALNAARDGFRKKIHLHNRDLRVMPADSWHQPDSIENQNKKVQKKSERTKDIFTDFELNDDAAIHKLNNDCLMHIFMFLPIVDRVKIERVCRRWKIVSQESWRTFKKLDLTQSTWGFNTVDSGPREIDTPTLRKVLLRCGQFLTHIDFSTFTEKLCKSTLTVVGRLCPNLQCIDITELRVSSSGIKALTNNCNNITEFSLGNCSGAVDNDLSQMFIKNKKLRYLKIVQNFSLTGKCLLNLPVDSIETLILNECNNISSLYFSNAIQTFSNLHTLIMENSISVNDQTVMKGISSCAKSLKTLRLHSHYFFKINLTAMSHIAELVNLETLNVSENELVQDKFLTLVGAQCKQLTTVNISHCNSVTNDGLASITSLPRLQHLYINYLSKVTDEVLTDMPNLRTMHCRGCSDLKDAGLCSLIEESPNIELLDFSNCSYISNKLIAVAIKATRNRTNNIVLTMYIGNTNVVKNEITEVSPFLKILNVNLVNSYLYLNDDEPEDNELDYIDEMFFHTK